MKSSASIAAAALFAVVFFAWAIFATVTVWNECRAENSFLYCMALVSRK